MSQPPRAPRPDDVGGETNDVALTVLATDGPVDSVTLMRGRRELIIRHGADTYRLRITASNKLILTK
ncbi:MAG: hemin uptake protein HemP [Rhodospirillales bacterium]|nr:hemin uptake protein HemP [Rhodospirillales bacterium]